MDGKSSGTDVFKETEKVLKNERRLDAIQASLKKLADKRSRILNYPSLFGDGRQIARERRICLEEIQLIMKEDWDG